MQLNSKGKLAKFYMWLPPDDKQLPKDFCTFFWGLVGRAFVVFIIGGFALTALIYGIVSGIIWLANLVWANKVKTLFILGWLLFMALVIWHSERKEKVKVKAGILSEVKVVIRGKVDAVKKRYCPRIEWTREPEASGASSGELTDTPQTSV